jgi:Holliday junction resolvase RusA-like endonuclease
MRRAARLDEEETMPDQIQFSVIGTPAPQGSKRHVGRGIMVESSQKVKPWRLAVVTAAREAMAGMDAPVFDEAVSVNLAFTLPKPASAPKRRTTWPSRKPDIDKLTRSTLDALTDAGMLADDARVVRLYATKDYPGEGQCPLDVPGVVVRVWRLGGGL